MPQSRGSPQSGRSTPGSRGQGYQGFHQQLKEALESATGISWNVYSDQLYLVPDEHDVPAWGNPLNLSKQMLLGRRIAKLVLKDPPDWVDRQSWKAKHVEVQVLFIPAEKAMLLSSNTNSKGFKADLREAFPNVQALFKRAWDTVKNHPLLRELPLAEGASAEINKDKDVRRSIGILSGLHSEGWNLHIVDNPDGRHAEQHLVEYAEAHFPDQMVDPPVGTRPPCYLCAVFMDEHDALRYYKNVEGEGNNVPVGNLYTKIYSGMRERLRKLGLSLDAPDTMKDADRERLVGSIAQGVARIFYDVISVRTGDLPDTPPDQLLSTPELNRAIGEAIKRDKR